MEELKIRLFFKSYHLDSFDTMKVNKVTIVLNFKDIQC